MKLYDIIIIGGGAAGFFTAINTATLNPNLSILILEKSKNVLQKVRISGGGRCNVTHAEFTPNELVKNYPRGEKELKGPFHSFMTGDTMEWFEKRGVDLKIENDGRIFPASNNSETIINCFLEQTKKFNITIKTQQLVNAFSLKEDVWLINTKENTFQAKKIVIATGSNPKIWNYLKSLNVSIINPVPSLFTFNTNSTLIKNLPGISQNVSLKIKGTNLKSSGPLLITHWGFSGPAILKLSAWGARVLNELNYQFELIVNWTLNEDFESCLQILAQHKKENPKQFIIQNTKFEIPKRLWTKLVSTSLITEKSKWADVSKKQLVQLSNQLTNCCFSINGKSTFKDEFVTAGGVDLKEIDFKTYKSKKLANCYVVGEIMNIDAITGGFNFQNAWTAGYIAAQSLAQKSNSL